MPQSDQSVQLGNLKPPKRIRAHLLSFSCIWLHSLAFESRLVQFRSKPNSRLTRFFPVFIDFLHTFLHFAYPPQPANGAVRNRANVHSADKYRRSLASSGESHLPDCRLRFAMPPSALCKILNSKRRMRARQQSAFGRPVFGRFAYELSAFERFFETIYFSTIFFEGNLFDFAVLCHT